MNVIIDKYAIRMAVLMGSVFKKFILIFVFIFMYYENKVFY